MDNKLVKQIPNIFTFIRIIFVIIGFILIINNSHILGLIILILGSITDYLDGYFARALDARSNIGAKLDQLADKLFEILICLALIIQGNYFFISILAIELIFSVLVTILFLKSRHWQESTKIGKIKTVGLFVTIIFGLLYLILKDFYITFLIVWIMMTIFQLFANIQIYKKYKNNNPSVEKTNKISN